MAKFKPPAPKLKLGGDHIDNLQGLLDHLHSDFEELYEKRVLLASLLLELDDQALAALASKFGTIDGSDAYQWYCDLCQILNQAPVPKPHIAEPEATSQDKSTKREEFSALLGDLNKIKNQKAQAAGDVNSTPASELVAFKLPIAWYEDIGVATLRFWTKDPGDHVTKDEPLLQIELEISNSAIENAGWHSSAPQQSERSRLLVLIWVAAGFDGILKEVIVSDDSACKPGDTLALIKPDRIAEENQSDPFASELFRYDEGQINTLLAEAVRLLRLVEKSNWKIHLNEVGREYEGAISKLKDAVRRGSSKAADILYFLFLLERVIGTDPKESQRRRDEMLRAALFTGQVAAQEEFREANRNKTWNGSSALGKAAFLSYYDNSKYSRNGYETDWSDGIEFVAGIHSEQIATPASWLLKAVVEGNANARSQFLESARHTLRNKS
jgi:hypothetical protein